ncbi:unnamed protein product [Orchesella dallaii]|uniref:Uncharacterized protein n=1 Tax=Orchesella dallaii TaxID=48710 RepID=A0ABP1RVL9_9HEXA
MDNKIVPLVLVLIWMKVKIVSAQWGVLENYGNWKTDDLRTSDEESQSASVIKFQVSKSTLEASLIAAVIIIIGIAGVLSVLKLCSKSQRKPSDDEEKLDKLPPAYEPPPSYDECV